MVLYICGHGAVEDVEMRGLLNFDEDLEEGVVGEEEKLDMVPGPAR